MITLAETTQIKNQYAIDAMKFMACVFLRTFHDTKPYNQDKHISSFNSSLMNIPAINNNQILKLLYFTDMFSFLFSNINKVSLQQLIDKKLTMQPRGFGDFISDQQLIDLPLIKLQTIRNNCLSVLSSLYNKNLDSLYSNSDLTTITITNSETIKNAVVSTFPQTIFGESFQFPKIVKSEKVYITSEKAPTYKVNDHTFSIPEPKWYTSPIFIIIVMILSLFSIIMLWWALLKNT